MMEWYLGLVKVWRVNVERTGRFTYRLCLTNGKNGDRNFTTADYYAWGTRRHAEAKGRRILRRFIREQVKSEQRREKFTVTYEGTP